EDRPAVAAGDGVGRIGTRRQAGNLPPVEGPGAHDRRGDDDLVAGDQHARGIVRGDDDRSSPTGQVQDRDARRLVSAGEAWPGPSQEGRGVSPVRAPGGRVEGETAPARRTGQDDVGKRGVGGERASGHVDDPGAGENGGAVPRPARAPHRNEGKLDGVGAGVDPPGRVGRAGGGDAAARDDKRLAVTVVESHERPDREFRCQSRRRIAGGRRVGKQRERRDQNKPGRKSSHGSFPSTNPIFPPRSTTVQVPLVPTTWVVVPGPRVATIFAVASGLARASFAGATTVTGWGSTATKVSLVLSWSTSTLASSGRGGPPGTAVAPGARPMFRRISSSLAPSRRAGAWRAAGKLVVLAPPAAPMRKFFTTGGIAPPLRTAIVSARRSWPFDGAAGLGVARRVARCGFTRPSARSGDSLCCPSAVASSEARKFAAWVASALIQASCTTIGRCGNTALLEASMTGYSPGTSAGFTAAARLDGFAMLSQPVSSQLRARWARSSMTRGLTLPAAGRANL